MAPPIPVPPLAPDELVAAGGERQVLEAFLDLYRDIMKRKLAGLSDQQIRQRHVRSQTTLGSLVKHLAAVEREWFQVVLAGHPAEELEAPAQDDAWTLSGDDTAETPREDGRAAMRHAMHLLSTRPTPGLTGQPRRMTQPNQP